MERGTLKGTCDPMNIGLKMELRELQEHAGVIRYLNVIN